MANETNAETADKARLIKRPELLADVLRHKGTGEVKVLTGVRRCGKSTLLGMVANELRAQGTPERNIFIKRFDDFDVPLGYSADDLYGQLRQFAENADSASPLYVFLDEIQDVPQWELVVRRLHTRAEMDVYITGSNSRLLSGDLATYLAGRYVEIPVFPLSFKEYQTISWVPADPAEALASYMRFGGMPGLFAHGSPSETEAREILEGIYQSIVIKDVAERNNIRDLASLGKVSRYLFATSGNLFSVRNVANTMNSAGTAISAKTVDAQISALENAYVIYRAEQTGVGGKRVLRPTNKYYPVDNGLRNLANNFKAADLGAQLEGVIYMELRRRGFTVNVGDTGREEIDFVASRGAQKRYIQVTASMLDENTRTRELRPLRALHDSFPRTVITLDPFSTGLTEDGIRIARATEWLTNQD